ncbi:MAG TPA: hypothetical protein VNQ56_10990 [Pseudolabrys sp.]|nr:hypothetical protein [Pseudolabrys sp.]
MRPATRIILFAAIWLAAGVTGASAQALMPGLSLQQDKPKLTPEQQAKAEKLDRAYRAATQSTPDQKAPDPWGNVRDSTAKPGTAKSGKPAATR